MRRAAVMVLAALAVALPARGDEPTPPSTTPPAAATATPAAGTPPADANAAPPAPAGAVPPALRDFANVLIDNDAPTTTEVGAWLKGATLTGDWLGWRTRLQEAGVQFAATYAADILGNPVGGLTQGVRYTHDLGLDWLFDLDRLLGLPGARLHASISSRAGHSLSANDIGNVFDVSQLCCEPYTRVVNLSWQQSLFADRLELHAGYLSTGDAFATSPLYWLFVTSGIDANPGALAFNVPFSEYPDTALGARARWQATRTLDLAAGIYNGSIISDAGMSDSLSVRFDDGVLAVMEGGWRPLLGGKERRLRGHYVLGGYLHSGRFRRFAAPPGSDLPGDVEHGNGGVYAQLDQMVWRADHTPTPDSVLIPFLALTGAPDDDINEFPFFVDAGLVLRGPLPTRRQDVAMFGVLYGGFSPALRDAQRAAGLAEQDFEMVLEWSYVIQVTPWLQLQPDLQYVIRPGGTGDIPDALVVGAQIAVNL